MRPSSEPSCRCSNPQHAVSRDWRPVTKRLDAKTVEALLAKLEAPPLAEIADMKILQRVVFGLEELAGADRHHAA